MNANGTDRERTPWTPRARRWAYFVLTILATGLVVRYVLPWAATNGYAGDVVKQNAKHDRDASALFWTESERTWTVLREVNRSKS